MTNPSCSILLAGVEAGPMVFCLRDGRLSAWTFTTFQKCIPGASFRRTCSPEKDGWRYRRLRLWHRPRVRNFHAGPCLGPGRKTRPCRICGSSNGVITLPGQKACRSYWRTYARRKDGLDGHKLIVARFICGETCPPSCPTSGERKRKAMAASNGTFGP